MRLRLACLLLLLFLAPLAARADDKDDKKGAASEALVTRLFDVGALTQGRPDFDRDLSVTGDFLSDYEMGPLFGSEGSEPIHPTGLIDEVIELVRMHIRADTWESVLGASIEALGERMLVVRNYPDVVDGVARFLGALQRRHMRRLCVEVETFRLTDGQLAGLLAEGEAMLADEAKLEALRGGELAGPAVAVCAYDRTRSAVFSGRQRAYIRDYDVEVAWGASISEPIVSVQNTGLTAIVRTILAPEGRSVLLLMAAALADPVGGATVDTGEGRVVELPEQVTSEVQSRLEIPLGRWALLEGRSAEPGDDRWVFAVRATELPLGDLAEVARGVTLASPEARPSRSFELRSYDIAMIGHPVRSRLGEPLWLTPSNFTPPEPDELPEPMAVLPGEAIVELLRSAIVPASWELRGAGMDLRNNYLFARNAPYVLDAIREQLDALRREFLWTLLTTAEAVDVPAALARRLEAAPDRLLDDAAAGALAEAIASGQATRLGTSRAATMPGGRNAVTVGRRTRYVSDYEVEIAQESTAANPVISECVSGTALDVEPLLTTGGQAAQVVLRWIRTDVARPMRKGASPHGEIGLPDMGLFRVRSTLQVPLGRTMVVAGRGQGDRRTLLLVRSELRREGR